MVFLALELVWLSFVAQGLYEHYLGDLLADSPNAVAAVVFYAIFVAGLVYFVIAPAVDEQSMRAALVRGAAFGLVTYATWDLTSLAVIEGFPVGIVPIDMAWGTSPGGDGQHRDVPAMAPHYRAWPGTSWRAAAIAAERYESSCACTGWSPSEWPD